MENWNMGHRIIENIQVPKNWESENDWDSHRPLLYMALENTNGVVIEAGCGFGSTPLIQKYCKEKNRIFKSYETNKEWAGKFNEVVAINSYDVLPQLDELPGVSAAFIDCAPAEAREGLIHLLKRRADVFVVHDSEESANYVYGMKDILGEFLFRLDYRPAGKPHTTAISNVIDVTQWKLPNSISSTILDESKNTNR